nr:unnamed protein product [Callosobruchus chinensis]
MHKIGELGSILIICKYALSCGFCLQERTTPCQPTLPISQISPAWRNGLTPSRWRGTWRTSTLAASPQWTPSST